MMNGISECCRYCKDRYPACHDYCDTYQNALKEWQTFKEKVNSIKKDEYDEYKNECIRKQRRRKNGK